MRYINNRNDFIKNKLNERFDMSGGSGPMGNDINWGDSLVGRLFNSMFRKVGVGVDQSSIKSVAKRINDIFYEITTNGINKENKETLDRIHVSYLLQELTNVVHNEEPIDVIEKVAKQCVTLIENSDLKKEDSAEAKRELNDFINFLQNQNPKAEESTNRLYKKIVDNLSSIQTIISYYKKQTDTRGVRTEGRPSKEKYTYTTRQGDTIHSIVNDKEINKKRIGSDSIWSKNPEALKKYSNVSRSKRNLVPLKPNLILVMESVKEIGGSSNRGTIIRKDETHLLDAFENLKRSIEVLISDREKGIAITPELIQNILKDRVNTENKEIIIKLYKNVIDKYLNDPSVQSVGALYNESIDIISDSKKANIVAEKIARFAKRVMQFKGTGLRGMGEVDLGVYKFIETFDALLKENDIKLEVETETENTKEYYDNNVSYNKWVVNQSQVDDIDQEITNNVSEPDMDRIIEIAKLMNKAHKIHTKEIIPSGRKNGKVSNKTFREYEYVGNGNSPAQQADDGGIRPGIGPYRNKSVFNKFESSIIDILGNNDYRAFLNTERGKILNKFIIELLDGEKLYKTGAQRQFFSEYFNLKIKDSKLGLQSEPRSTKVVTNESSSSFRKTNKIKSIDRTFYAVETQSGIIYIMIINKGNDVVYIKYSSSFYNFDKYLGNQTKVGKGNLNNLDKTPNKDVFYVSINADDFDLENKKYNLKILNLRDYNDNRSNVSAKNNTIDIKNIYQLVDDNGNIIKLDNSANTYSGNNDSNKYTDLNQLIK